MQDILGEAGLSIGAFYRYFKGKDDLIRAIAEHNVGRLEVAVQELGRHEPPLSLSEAMDRALDFIEPLLVRHGVANIALQVWSESLRDPELAGFVGAAYGQLRGGFVALAVRAQQAGHLPAEVDAATLGVALFGTLPGYLLQRLLTGKPDREVMRAGVRALLNTPCH
jgi:AcrR family transcriptional regulator